MLMVDLLVPGLLKAAGAGEGAGEGVGRDRFMAAAASRGQVRGDGR